jgi:hypothetical protein
MGIRRIWVIARNVFLEVIRQIACCTWWPSMPW